MRVRRQPKPQAAAPATSYTATGLQEPPPASTVEGGSSRLNPIQEVVPELISPFARTQVYARMMNDAGVDVSVRIWKTPILGSEFFVEPYDDTPLSREIAEFIASNLFGGMSTPFVSSIEDILHFCEDGYAVLEPVFENRVWYPKRQGANAKTFTMLKKLGVRPIQTITNIEYDDNGGPKELMQKAIQADGSLKDVKLPIDKLIIFTLNKKGGDITGRSVLRTAYPHWYYKTHMYKIDAIQKERHSLGVPKGQLQPGFTEQDKVILRDLLRNLRTNEESFMLLTPFIDVEFAEIRGNLVDVLSSATHHNTMILMNVMAQFVTLGVEGQGGGRATAGAQTDIFMKSLHYIANYIADQYNMYLIPKLVVWNYKTVNFPQLKVRNIGETRDLQMFASALSNLFAQSALTSDIETENWIRNVFDMPAKDPTAEVIAAPPTPADGNGAGAGKGDVKQARDKIGGNAGKPPTAAE